MGTVFIAIDKCDKENGCLKVVSSPSISFASHFVLRDLGLFFQGLAKCLLLAIHWKKTDR